MKKDTDGQETDEDHITVNGFLKFENHCILTKTIIVENMFFSDATGELYETFFTDLLKLSNTNEFCTTNDVYKLADGLECDRLRGIIWKIISNGSDINLEKAEQMNLQDPRRSAAQILNLTILNRSVKLVIILFLA